MEKEKKTRNYNKKSIEDIDVSGKRVLCRCDFNVPTKDGKITSDKRIVAAMPTIEYLVNHGAKVILCSEARSLNLSNAVAITTYEALRQLSFPNLKDYGKMRG